MGWALTDCGRFGEFPFCRAGRGRSGRRGRRAEAPCNGACLALAPLAIPHQRPAVFPRESVAALKYIPLAGTEKMFAQSPILPTDCTGYQPEGQSQRFQLSHLSRIWQGGSWHVYSGKYLGGRGYYRDGFKHQDSTTIWLSLVITVLLSWPCHDFEGFK